MLPSSPDNGLATRKDEIVDLAARLFQTKGYHETSVQEIADEVALTKASLYYYIRSKEDLLFEIHERFINFVLERARESDQTTSARERLANVVRDVLQVIRDYRAHVTVFFRERYGLSPERAAIIAAKRREYEQFVEQIVVDGIRNGEFRSSLDPKVVTMAVFGMCNWTYQWYRPSGRLSAGEIVDQFTGLLFDGLAADPDGQA